MRQHKKNKFVSFSARGATKGKAGVALFCCFCAASLQSWSTEALVVRMIIFVRFNCCELSVTESLLLLLFLRTSKVLSF